MRSVTQHTHITQRSIIRCGPLRNPQQEWWMTLSTYFSRSLTWCLYLPTFPIKCPLLLLLSFPFHLPFPFPLYILIFSASLHRPAFFPSPSSPSCRVSLVFVFPVFLSLLHSQLILFPLLSFSLSSSSNELHILYQDSHTSPSLLSLSLPHRSPVL